MIRILSIVAVVSLGLAATSAEAKSCRDAAGKFSKCPAAAAAAPTSGGRLVTARRPAAAPAPSAARAAATAGRPAAATVPTGTASARCRDGSLSFSQHRSGTCAGHGGVANWM